KLYIALDRNLLEHKSSVGKAPRGSRCSSLLSQDNFHVAEGAAALIHNRSARFRGVNHWLWRRSRLHFLLFFLLLDGWRRWRWVLLLQVPTQSHKSGQARLTRNVLIPLWFVCSRAQSNLQCCAQRKPCSKRLSRPHVQTKGRLAEARSIAPQKNVPAHFSKKFSSR